jgi:cytoskeleton protein RodZ
MHRKEDNIHVAQFRQEPASGQRESVAAVLSRARERHGQDIRSVAQVLRIRQAYLEALESGEFAKLPGTAYALGFLRTYAEYLGLNANNIIDRFKEEVHATDRPTELIFPEPVIEGRIPGGAIILISVALLMVAYGGWFYLSNQGRSIADLVPALPEQIQALIDRDGVEPAPGAPEAPVVQAEAPLPLIEQAAEASSDEPAAVPDPTPEPISVPAPAQTEAQRSVEAPPAPPPAPVKVTTVAVPEEAEPVPQTQVQAAEPTAIAEPSETTQAAVQPRAEAAPDTYPGPPISSDPAPELAALTREEAPLPTPKPVEALVQAEAPVQTQLIEPQDSTDPIVARTVVIPAPPAAPQDFSRLGERTPQVYGEGNEGARIVLHALQDSWVQVRDNRDALLLTRVLRSGDVYRVPDQAGLTLLTGNAGGIQLEVDGVRLAPLGPIGSVRRQIALDPTALLTGATQ